MQQAFTQPAPVAPAAPSHDFQVHHEMSSQVTGDVMGQNNTLQARSPHSLTVEQHDA